MELTMDEGFARSKSHGGDIFERQNVYARAYKAYAVGYGSCWEWLGQLESTGNDAT